MKRGIAWPSILVMVLILPWVGAASCLAQSRATVAAASPRAKPAATSTPTVDLAARQGERPLSPALPSTVSPAIERFVRQIGRDLPPGPSTLPPPIRPPDANQGGRPEPVPTPASSPRVNPLESVDIGDLLPPPPSFRGTAPATSSNPLATGLTLRPAPAEPSDVRLPINLATALRLSDARPLVIAAAQASVWVAEAQLTRAKVLWVPALNVAVDYLRHDGGGPDFNKGIMTAPSVNFFYAGAGLWGTIATTDALYEPLLARQVLNARHWDVQSAKNDALLRTADAYFRVHQHRGMYAGALYTVARGRELVGRVDELSRDLVPEVEAERARNMLADLEQRAVLARQQWRVASADLTEVLRLDPRAVVEPLEHDHAQVTLVDPGRPLDELMPVALANRPELASRRALVGAAEIAVRREKARPLLPMVILSGFQSPGGMLIQGGIFGMGPNGSLDQWRGRDDVSIQLVWQVENLGIGNLARIKARRGDQSRAIVDLRRAQDAVAADVMRSQARLQSAAARVAQADRALRTAIITFNGTFEGLRQTSRFGDVLTLVNRPQEAVYALQLLNVAFEQYFGTVAEYNRSQFELFHALGYPAQEVTALRAPGVVLPADTGRPHYLPPVGNGPPPATR
jgi:outer membrane protein TolC